MSRTAPEPRRGPKPPRPNVSRPSPTAGATGPLSSTTLVDLQRLAGNDAVQRLLGDDLTVSRQVPPVYTAPTPGSPPPAGGAPAPAPTVVLNGATPLDKASDGFTRATPDTIEEAWRLLFGQAMYDLLPNLAGLKAKGHWGVITAGAGPRGGTRWTNAVLAVDLKTKGSPITKDELRDLIDKLSDMFPDQRADILKFIGKYVVITVDGIDLDFSYVAGATGASCVKAVQDEMAEARFFIKEYQAAGAQKGVKTGAQVEAAVKASLARQGMGVSVAGSTSSTGAITITATTMTKAQPIMTRNTEIHESVHSHHVADLKKQYGKGFKAVFNDAGDWVRDEVNARNAEIVFLTKVVAALNQLETMVK